MLPLMLQHLHGLSWVHARRAFSSSHGRLATKPKEALASEDAPQNAAIDAASQLAPERNPRGLPVVSAEAAAHVASAARHLPASRLPARLQEVFERRLRDSGVRAAELRRLSSNLLGDLREMGDARSKAAASASSPSRYDPAAPPRVKGPQGSKHGALALDSAVAEMELSGILGMDAATVNAALGLPPPLRCHPFPAAPTTCTLTACCVSADASLI